VVLGGLITVGVYVQAIFHPLTLPPRQDPVARLRGWPELNAQVGQLATAGNAAFIASDNYATAAMLARSGGTVPVVGVEPRWRYFNLPGVTEHLAGLLVRPADRGSDSQGWQDMAPLARITRGAETYLVFSVLGTPPGVVLPRLDNP
jgi:hypothetical protein